MSNNTRTALITGATAGLGKEFARQLAAAGYDLVLVARNQEALATTADAMTADFGIQAQWIAADLADPAAPRAVFDETRSRGLQVDYLVNNAGVAGPNLLEESDWSKQHAFYQLMMLSIAELCHLFIPPMQERGFGRVINVASMAGRIPRGGGCNYGPTKAWVIAVSEELALTAGRDGVNVSALCPGFTHTEFHERAGLMDMKNSMPAWMWYDAATVVSEGIAAAERGRRVLPSGRLYRLLDPLAQSVWTRRFFSVGDGR